MKTALCIIGFLILAASALAHEVRPAYLMMEEQDQNHFSLLWKTPMVGGYIPPIQLQLPEHCQQASEIFSEVRDGAYIRSWTVNSGPKGLEGKILAINGLAGTLIDVIVLIRWKDGRNIKMMLTPEKPFATVTPSEKKQTGSFAFLEMGIKHILYGGDHLAFLFCIILFVRRPVPLLKTVTAFTLAHSITLFLVAFEAVRVPQRPVEIMVALSIVLLASEVLKKKAGSAAGAWKLTFGFGLLHGLGYASALKGIGLPEGDLMTALILFNLGVEVGQIGFILAVLTHLALLQRIWAHSREVTEKFATNIIGITGVFWIIQRMAGMMFPG